MVLHVEVSGGPGHSCEEESGVLVCTTLDLTRLGSMKTAWMAVDLTMDEVLSVPDGDDLCECMVCHRRFTMACSASGR